MFHRLISVFLCSCLLAASVPQISYAGMMENQSSADLAYITQQGDSAVFFSDNEEEKAEEEELELLDDGDDDGDSGSDGDGGGDGGGSQSSEPSPASTSEPTSEPGPESTSEPGPEPTSEPSPEPTSEPSPEPSSSSEETPTEAPSVTEEPSQPEEVPSSEESSSSEEAPSIEASSTTEESSSSEESSSEKESRVREESSSIEESSWIEEESSELESSEEESSEEETTRINAEELKFGQPKEIILQSGNDAQWFQYTAPESGYYNFYIEGSDTNNISLSIYDLRENGKQLKRQTYQNNVRYAVMYMEKGQTAYPSISLTGSASSSSRTIIFGVKYAKTASVEATDSKYIVNTDRFTANIGWKPGSRTVAASITLSPKEGKNLNGSYYWQIKYGNSELGYQYINELISPGTKKDKDITELDPGVEYSFSMYLVNADTLALEAVLISDSSSIKMKTGGSKENLLIRGTRSGYDSITLSIEAAETVSKYCYGPVAGYDEEITVQKRISGISSISVSNLQPATTYYFEFYNSKGVVFGYTTVDTKEYPAKINYTATTTGSDTIALKAEILEYAGKTPEYFNLCYEVLDSAGNLAASGMEKVSAKGSEKWSIQAQVPDLEAETEYTVTMWISEPGYTAHFKETSQSVMTHKAPFPAEALSIEINRNAGTPTKADYSVVIADYDGRANGKLKYRMKDSLGEYETKTVTIVNGKAKGSITNLQKGMEYEYELRVLGVINKGTFVMGEAAIHPEMTDDTGAYDSIISYRLKRSELTEGASYSAKLYYYNEETKLYGEIENKLALTADEDYAVSVQASDYFSLSPDTVYGFKWELYAGTALVDTQYQLIRTQASDVTVEITANMADSVSYNIGINGRTENISRDITLFTYLCGEDSEYRKQGDSFNLYASKSYKASGRTLSGLDDDMNYTVSFRDIKGKEYGSYTFTFEAKIDGVRLNVGNQTTGAHNITIQAQIEGEPSPESYLILFFKEKNEEDWDIRSVLLEDKQTECNFELTTYLGDEINADTIYEYVVGISDQQYPSASTKLEGVYSGEILTQTDGRNLAEVSAGSGYSYISVKAMLTNNPINTNSYIYVFYREKGEKDWIKSNKSFIISKTTGGILAFISDLKPGTEYEYVVGVSDIGYGISLHDIEEDRRISGTVMTKQDDFKINVRTVKKQDGWSGMEVNVKVDTDTQVKNLKAVLTLSDGQTKEVILSKDRHYTDNVTFDNLYTGKNYTVRNVAIQVMETVTGKCDYVTVATFEP